MDSRMDKFLTSEEVIFGKKNGLIVVKQEYNI